MVLYLLTINAINFIDGLDGLAAGVSASRPWPSSRTPTTWPGRGTDDLAFAPSLLTAVLAGACLGFLPHNFYPARIFMGDSGSMLIGLTLAARGDRARARPSRRSPTAPADTSADVPAVPAAAGGARGAAGGPGHGRGPPDQGRALARSRRTSCTCTTGCWRSGTRHRRAVLLIYFWSALLAFGGVAMSLIDDRFGCCPWSRRWPLVARAGLQRAAAARAPMSESEMTGPAAVPEPDAPHVKNGLRLAATMQRHALLLSVPLGVPRWPSAARCAGRPAWSARDRRCWGCRPAAHHPGHARDGPHVLRAGVTIGAMTSLAGKILLLMLFSWHSGVPTRWRTGRSGSRLAVTIGWIAGEVIGFVACARRPSWTV